LAALAAFVSTAGAIDLDVTTGRIQAALSMARGREPARAAFHKPYIFSTGSPIVDNIEVITEFRRLVKIAEAQIADGNPFFAQNTAAAQEALRPFRNRVSVVAYLRFHPQNAYVVGPLVEVALLDEFVPLPRLDMQVETLFARWSGPAGQRVPVAGATAEGVFDSAVVGQQYRTIVVTLDGKDVARVTTDFGRLE
jgi:hypothetical protein